MRRWAELTSFLVGAAAALLLLASWRVPSAHVNPRTALTVGIAPSKAVDLSRTGMVLHARGVKVGKTFTSTVALRNPGHAALHVRPRLEVLGDPVVGEAVHAQVVAAGGEQLFDGTASRLSESTARRFWIDPDGGATAVTLRLKLPRDEAGTAAGREARLRLRFDVETVMPRTALTVGIPRSKAVQLSQTGRVLHQRDFTPDTPFTETVTLRNDHHTALRLRPRLEVQGDHDAAEALQAEVIGSGGNHLFGGPALRLSQATAQRLWVQPDGGTTTVTLRLTLPRDAQGTLPRASTLRLVFEVDP